MNCFDDDFDIKFINSLQIKEERNNILSQTENTFHSIEFN